MEEKLEKIEKIAKLDTTIKLNKLNKLNKFLRRDWVLPTVTSVLGFGAGALAGYMAIKSQYDRLETGLEELKSEQLELDFARAEKDHEFNLAIQQAAKVTNDLRVQSLDMIEKVQLIAGTATRTLEEKLLHPSEAQAPTPLRSVGRPEVEGVVTNIFDEAGDEWNYESELETRTAHAPYVIHVDEFVSDEMGWDSQTTITWYEGDQILCDSTDKPIYNWPDVIGEIRFGHGSNDPNIFYVRNERMQAEFEILRDVGSYQEVVMGEALEHKASTKDLRHAHELRKFRDD